VLALRALVPALILSVAAPAAADWLVTHSGDHLETRGPWELRGAQVVFTTPAGRLASIRATEIDLEASRALTDSPPSVAAVVEPQARRPVALVLTDADVGHTRPSDTPDAEAEGDLTESGDAESERVSAAAQVEILQWQERVDVDRNALVVTGQVANRGESLVTDIRLEVRLVDSSGTVRESRGATTDRSVLRPGERAEFTALFPGSPGFASIDFDLQSRGFRVRPPAGSG